LELKLIKRIDFPPGIFVFALFGIYSLTLAPTLTDFLKYRHAGNYFIAFFGFLIYVLEIFAFNFKLHMVRIRAEERRIKLQQITGEQMLIPRAGVMIWIGLFFRMMFRVGIIAISVTALGFPVEGLAVSMSGIGMAAGTIAFFLEGALLIYTCMTTNFFNSADDTQREYDEELKKDTEWIVEELKSTDAENNFTKELIADIVLQIYAFMLYTAWWDYVNGYAITMGEQYFASRATAAEAMFKILPMLLIMSLLAIIPLRLAYWIEDASTAFTDKEKWKTRRAFLIATAITISPAIIGIFHIYFLND
jgi:hypothetical protein